MIGQSVKLVPLLAACCTADQLCTLTCFYHMAITALLYLLQIEEQTLGIELGFEVSVILPFTVIQNYKKLLEEEEQQYK